MTVQASDGVFSSPDSHHKAVRVNLTGWAVTYLEPGRRLTRPQAWSAIQLAGIVGAAEEPIGQSDSMWCIVAVLAAELGLAPLDAIRAAERPIRWEV